MKSQETSKNNSDIKNIVDKKISPPNVVPKYFSTQEGLQKMKKGMFAFFTDPASSYWLINDMFNDVEKCDMMQIPAQGPEVGSFMFKKRSPYKKLISYG